MPYTSYRLMKAIREKAIRKASAELSMSGSCSNPGKGINDDRRFAAEAMTAAIMRIKGTHRIGKMHPKHPV